MANLGNLYTDKTGILKHREWRGVKDTAYDYYRWLITWKDLIMFVGRDPVVTVKAIFRYRWMTSYLSAPAYIDRHMLGLRGTPLRVGHMHFNAIIKAITDLLHDSLAADENLNGPNELSKKILCIDELIPPQIMAGFPNLRTIPIQAAPYFICSMVDKNICYPYIDAAENFGIPADVCPLPSGEAGCAIENDYPKFGKCMITNNMPCDGSIMTSSYQDKIFKLPSHVLAIPLRYNDDVDADTYTIAELLDCIHYIEEQTGETYDWDACRQACEIYNQQTHYENEKWDINKTPYPQVTGCTLWIYRLYSFQMAAGVVPALVKVDKKVNKLITKAYEEHTPNIPEIRHRAVIWSCPANYYTDFPRWLEECWGIVGLMDMETMVSNVPIDTSTHESILLGIGQTYQRATMRRHTNGGYKNALDELWDVVEDFDADLIIMYDQVSCKGMDGLQGMFDEQAKERDINMIWVQQDLMDARTISRREMREQVNKYMTTVMNEEPLDPTLLDFDDSLAW